VSVLLSTLITSKARVELITWFITHPGERTHYNELIRILDANHPSIQRELKRLESAGLLQSSREANVKFYWVNQEFLLYREIKAIVMKTVGLGDTLRRELQELDGVEVAFIYGSVARDLEDARSDIDLMVIGDIEVDAIHKAVAECEKTLGREVNYSVYDVAEWQHKVKKKG
jgi:predicted nucleotidyltransferase